MAFGVGHRAQSRLMGRAHGLLNRLRPLLASTGCVHGVLKARSAQLDGRYTPRTVRIVTFRLVKLQTAASIFVCDTRRELVYQYHIVHIDI